LVQFGAWFGECFEYFYGLGFVECYGLNVECKKEVKGTFKMVENAFFLDVKNAKTQFK
jgi:hypothetical protein